jgi:hypothetical protein
MWYYFPVDSKVRSFSLGFLPILMFQPLLNKHRIYFSNMYLHFKTFYLCWKKAQDACSSFLTVSFENRTPLTRELVSR